MSSKPKFYLPVILPPLKDQKDPPAYYAGIKTLGVDTTINSAADGFFEIRIANSNLLHPSNQFDQPLLFSTVFAPMSGFVRFYPGSAILPQPIAALIAPPTGLNAADVGSLIIRIWISDFFDSVTARSPEEQRANRIVLGWLNKATVETAFAAETAKLKDNVLAKSWKDAGGTGSIPDRSTLISAFCERFMAGGAEVFVSAGAALGSAAMVTATDSKLKLYTFFQPPESPAIFVEADDLIDNAVSQSLLSSHPLIAASNGPIQITFKSRFMIWNNQTRNYQALANTLVTLMTAPDNITVDAKKTDSDGRLDLTPQDPLAKRDLIFFSYDTTGMTVGNHEFARDIETERHFARQFVNSNHENTHEYQASDDIYPAYRDFIDELGHNARNEQFERDRGNGATWDTSNAFSPVKYMFSFASQKGFLMRIRDSEKRYKELTDSSSKVFSLLVEGDSWLSYPPDGETSVSVTQYSGDIYGRLDQLLSSRLEQPVPQVATYLRFPLQHHGDRSDQMFAGDQLDPTRQWYFTRKFLNEYKIDAVVCSAGGNDIAEPGISHWVLESKNDTAKALSTCFTDQEFKHSGEGGYFDPLKMSAKLTAEQQEVATQLMEKSFAVLLIDHPWNIFLRTAPLTKPGDLWQALPGWNSLGGSANDPNIGAAVIDNIGDFTKFPDPDPNADIQQRLLATVFDSNRYKARFDTVKAHWEILLTEAQLHGTRVFSHTYCYPLFNRQATKHIQWITGPWFGVRFRQAKITDFRIQYICLKAILDNYKYCVLDKLVTKFAGTFEYVEVRNKAANANLWADEMHLTSDGYKPLAARLYNKVVDVIKTRLNIDLPKEPE